MKSVPIPVESRAVCAVYVPFVLCVLYNAALFYYNFLEIVTAYMVYWFIGDCKTFSALKTIHWHSVRREAERCIISKEEECWQQRFVRQ